MAPVDVHVIDAEVLRSTDLRKSTLSGSGEYDVINRADMIDKAADMNIKTDMIDKAADMNINAYMIIKADMPISTSFIDVGNDLLSLKNTI